MKSKLVYVNPGDRDWTKGRYVLSVGSGPTYLMVCANGIEDALDECVDYLADHAPGLLADEQVHEEYNRCIGEGMSEEDAIVSAETDTTQAGNSGHYLLSWEWGIVAENPTRDWLLATFDIEVAK